MSPGTNRRMEQLLSGHKPPPREERCCICDEATGHAGKGEDSLYCDLPDGQSDGPFCDECHTRVLQYIELWEVHAAALNDEIDLLKASVEDAYQEGWEDHSLQGDEPFGSDMLAHWKTSNARKVIA